MRQLQQYNPDAKIEYTLNSLFYEDCLEHLQELHNEQIDMFLLFGDDNNFHYVIANPQTLQKMIIARVDAKLQQYYPTSSTDQEHFRKVAKEKLNAFFASPLTIENKQKNANEWCSSIEHFANDASQDEQYHFHIVLTHEDVAFDLFNYEPLNELIDALDEMILPFELRNVLTDEQKRILRIATSSILFYGISKEEILKLIPSFKVYKFRPQEIIYNVGTTIKTLDFILKGKVDFFTHSGEYIASLKEKNIFGEQMFHPTNNTRRVEIQAANSVVLVSLKLNLNNKELHPKTVLQLYKNLFVTLSEKLMLVSKI